MSASLKTSDEESRTFAHRHPGLEPGSSAIKSLIA
jgi:hypothetical protein